MEKIKVRATQQYESLNLKDKELDYIPQKGEVFEVSEERFLILTKNNPHNAIFVEKIEETSEVDDKSEETEEESSKADEKKINKRGNKIK